MNFRCFAGALCGFGYNRVLSHVPSRSLRRACLRVWLGQFGAGTSVQSGCQFLNGSRIYLGQRNVINFGCLLDGRKFGIRTGDDVSIGPEAAILTLGHDPQAMDFADRGGEVLIGERVWIAYRAVVLPGVNIGAGSVVAAGSVVTRDVEPFTIVAGNPAKKIGQRNPNLSYSLDYHPFLG